MGLLNSIKRRIGTKQMKIDAIDDEIFEHRNYIKLYKKEIEIREHQITALEAEREKISWKN